MGETKVAVHHPRLFFAYEGRKERVDQPVRDRDMCSPLRSSEREYAGMRFPRCRWRESEQSVTRIGKINPDKPGRLRQAWQARPHSATSHNFGPKMVPIAQLRGQAFFPYASLGRACASEKWSPSHNSAQLRGRPKNVPHSLPQALRLPHVVRDRRSKTRPPSRPPR